MLITHRMQCWKLLRKTLKPFILNRDQHTHTHIHMHSKTIRLTCVRISVCTTMSVGNWIRNAWLQWWYFDMLFFSIISIFQSVKTGWNMQMFYLSVFHVERSESMWQQWLLCLKESRWQHLAYSKMKSGCMKFRAAMYVGWWERPRGGGSKQRNCN